MKRGIRFGLFRMVFSFCTGVLVTLFCLIPGKTGPTVLVSGDSGDQSRQMQEAEKRLEGVCDRVLTALYAVKTSVSEKRADEARL